MKIAYPFILSLSIPLFLSLLFHGNLVAQQEIGVRTNTNLSNFDFIYKKEQKSDKYIRYRATSFKFDVKDINEQTRTQFSFLLAMGRETRRPIHEKIELITGFEPNIIVEYYSIDKASNLSGLIGLGFIFGLQYQVNKEIFINVETIPTLSAPFVFREGRLLRYGINGRLDIQDVALSVFYRFGG